MSANEDCKELLEEIQENIQLDIIDETKLEEVYLKIRFKSTTKK